MRDSTLDGDGRVQAHRLRVAVTDGLVRLPDDPARYFLPSGRDVMLPVSSLVASRARDEGVPSANRLMTDAWKGLGGRRVPIRVAPLDDGRWLVLDGNSTFINALFSGWVGVPCDRVDASERPADGRA